MEGGREEGEMTIYGADFAGGVAGALITSPRAELIHSPSPQQTSIHSSQCANERVVIQ